MEELKPCPVCGQNALELGERVDVGFGLSMGVKAGPDHCLECGYIEQGPNPRDKPIEYYRQCWEQKVDPHPPMPDMKRGPLPCSYTQWITDHVVGDGYGQCKEWAIEMSRAFPELKVVYGTYFCWKCGPRAHWWCIDKDFVVCDPTSQQFPSKGGGMYAMEFEHDPKLDDVAHVHCRL